MHNRPPARDGAPAANAAEELALIYDTAPVGLCVLDTEGRFLRVNRRLAEVNGVPAAAHIGRSIREVVPDVADICEAALRRVLETGEPVRNVEVEGETAARRGVWLEDWSPLRDREGRIVGVNVVACEVTHLRDAERVRREGEARLAAVLDVLPVGVGLIDRAGRMVLANREMRRFVPEKIPSQDAARRDRWIGLHPDGSRVAPEDFPGARALRGETVLPGIEFQHVMDDGSEVWTRVAAVPLRDEAGAITGAVTVVSDISAARAAEEQQALLTRELDHRAKNSLSVVLAALRLTPKDDAVAFARAVEGRVAALSRAHALLAAGRWEGTALRPLIEAGLSAFLPGRPAAAGAAAGPPQVGVSLQGDDIRLTAAATQALTIAMHELATNAVKYGALGVPGGSLAVTWGIDAAAGLLRLRWAERGGPPLAGPPQRSGFGSRVLRATVCGQLGGTVERAWKPEGLVCDLALPLDRVLAGSRRRRAGPERTAPA